MWVKQFNPTYEQSYIPQQLEETLGIFKFDNAQSVKSANSHKGWY